VHRDLKLANILVNFPKNKELLKFDKDQKMEFLSKVNLLETEFEIKIGDFGFAK
jgi:serine/threonine protein kinase